MVPQLLLFTMLLRTCSGTLVSVKAYLWKRFCFVEMRSATGGA
ncbi:unnamed protein product [Brassica rapa]|uniref:Uncharacterized protein n=1 Tax=Brassica campestris TaxID=3711 RepID=A0A8D9G7Q7_BRACM|nr:unnamed protein product [Brassica rapa]